MENPKYRPDIDGLRAFGVLAVIAYHAFPEIVTGGFIGVDVFFVISGYLISTIIFANLENGQFSYADFYGRRIKRIFPALLLVMAASLIIGWIVLFASEYKKLGEQAFAASIFASNFLLYAQSGYFDTQSATKQLLHLWSLGVEEQFYIVWPLLAAFAWKRWRFLALVGILFALSEGANIYMTLTNPVSAFYLPWSRFWELMMGSILAYLHLHHKTALRAQENVQSVLGLSLLALGMILAKNTDFPGWRALFPTLGAFFLISAGPKAVVNRFLLASAPMIGIGLISYPLYLWHWPLLSFVRVMEGGDLPLWGAIASVTLSFILAYATYEFLEKKVRHSRSGFKVPALLCGLMALVGVLSLAIYANGGISARAINRLNASDNFVGDASSNLMNTCGLSPEEKQLGIATCVSDKRAAPVYAVLGDSKAAALFPGLVHESTERGRWMLIGGNGSHGAVEPVLSDDPFFKSDQALAMAASDAVVRNPTVRVVVLVAATRALFQTQEDLLLRDLPDSPNASIVFDGLDRMIAKLSASGKKVILFVDNPTLPEPTVCMDRDTGIDTVDRIFAHKKKSECSLGYGENRKLTQKYADVLQRLAAKWGAKVRLFDPTDLLCSSSEDVCPYQKDGHMLYSYTDHVSDYASRLIGRALNDQLAREAP